MQSYEALALGYDLLMDDVDYDEWSRYLLSFMGDRATCADVACGTGAITARLAGAGLKVTGVDLSESMLAIARENAPGTRQRVVYVRQDMRELELHKPVDVVNCANDGVNYLVDDGDALRFFQSAYRALKPGGLLLFDVSTPYKLEQVLGDNTFAEDRETLCYIWQNDFEAGLCAMRLTLFYRQADGRYARYDEEHLQRAYSMEELLTLLGEAGFSDIRQYSFLTRDKAVSHDERWQIAARRG